MGRKKIKIEPLVDFRIAQSTFHKRRVGLLKKGYELSVLCQCNVTIVVHGNNNKLYTFSSTGDEGIRNLSTLTMRVADESLDNNSIPKYLEKKLKKSHSAPHEPEQSSNLRQSNRLQEKQAREQSKSAENSPNHVSLEQNTVSARSTNQNVQMYANNQINCQASNQMNTPYQSSNTVNIVNIENDRNMGELYQNTPMHQIEMMQNERGEYLIPMADFSNSGNMYSNDHQKYHMEYFPLNNENVQQIVPIHSFQGNIQYTNDNSNEMANNLPQILNNGPHYAEMMPNMVNRIPKGDFDTREMQAFHPQPQDIPRYIQPTPQVNQNNSQQNNQNTPRLVFVNEMPQTQRIPLESHPPYIPVEDINYQYQVPNNPQMFYPTQAQAGAGNPIRYPNIPVNHPANQQEFNTNRFTDINSPQQSNQYGSIPPFNNIPPNQYQNRPPSYPDQRYGYT